MIDSKFSNIVLQVFNAAPFLRISAMHKVIFLVMVYSQVPNHFVRAHRDVGVKFVDFGQIL